MTWIRPAQPGAPVLHDYCPSNVSVNRKIQYGDMEKGFAEVGLYPGRHLHRPRPVSHAYLEPCSALAQADQDGRITLWTSTQVPYIVQCLLASTLGMRENDIRVIKPFVGGGFGGKMELRTWEFCAALMAKKTGRPVKFTLSREEEFLAGRRRHPMKIHSKVGFKKDGTLVAKDLKIQLDGGAYNAMGPTATFLCGNFGAMLYRYPSYRFHGRARLHQQAAGQRHARLRRPPIVLCHRDPDEYRGRGTGDRPGGPAAQKRPGERGSRSPMWPPFPVAASSIPSRKWRR